MYDKSGVVGSLDGVAPYAKAQKISNGQAKKELEKNLVYTNTYEGTAYTNDSTSYMYTSHHSIS